MTEQEALIKIRKQLKLSQTELARSLDVSQSIISAIEVGTREMSYDVYKKLVTRLNVNPWYFIKEKEPMFVTGNSEITALKNKILDYEKLIDKLVHVSAR